MYFTCCVLFSLDYRYVMYATFREAGLASVDVAFVFLS